MDGFSHLDLVQELQRRANASDPVALDLYSRLVRSVPRLNTLLAEIRRYHPHFTDHSISHSARIVRNIQCVLGPEQFRRDPTSIRPVLSSVDIFLLIAGALVHDIGMVIPDSEAAELLRSGVVLPHPDCGDVRDGYWHGVTRLQLAELARRHHPQRSMVMLMEQRFVPASLYEDAQALLKYLGLVAAAHGLDFDRVAELPNRAEIQLGGSLQQECNPRFAAVCLRIGDLLDIGQARACPILRGLSEPLSATSKAHWDQYQDIQIEGLRYATDIVINGTCPSQDAERVLREWIGWLEQETANAVRLQNTDESRYRLSIGRVLYKVRPAQTNGKPAYEFLQFKLNLDERQVFERLFGKALYGRSELTIRELVQNATDAQRARVLFELGSAPGWSQLDESTREARYSARLKSVAGSMPIVVELSQSGGDEQRWHLTFHDSGVGMSRDTIANYLLKVGRSRWSNDNLTTRLGIGSKSIGTFGIGFVSTLMVADRIEVETRSCLPNEEAIKATIFGWQGFAATAPGVRSTAGTSVDLRLVSMDLTSPDKLMEFLSQQVPLSDFPIILAVAGQRLTVPRVDPSKTARQTTVPLGETGSTLTIRETRGSAPVTIWAPDAQYALACALCQDGIAVSGVRAPVGETPWSQVLAAFGVLLDLRGSARVALDLSRNLIEGDVDAFWAEQVPQCWEALFRASFRDWIARRAVSSLIETVFLRLRCRPIFLDGTGTMARSAKALADTEAVTCLETEGREWPPAAKLAIWFCPPSAHFDPFVLDSRVDEVLGDLREAEWEQSVAIEEGMVAEESDESESEQPPEEEQSVFVSGGNWRSLDEEERQKMRLTGNVLRAWRELSDEFPWVSRRPDVGVVLSRHAAEKSVRWDQVLSFPVTPHWRCFCVENGSVISPVDGFNELAEAAQAHGLSYADFLVYMCLNYHNVGSSERLVLDGKLAVAARTIQGRREEDRNKIGEDASASIREDLFDDPEEDDEFDDADDERARSSKREDWASKSALPFFFAEDAYVYRGLAKEVGLAGAVFPGDGWPVRGGASELVPAARARREPTRRLQPRARKRRG